MALAWVAVAVGLLAAGIVLDAWALVRRATIEQYAASAPPAITLTVDSVDAPLLGAVRANPAVAAAEARRTVGVTARGAGGSLSGALFVADGLAAQRIGRLRLEGGRWPDGDSVLAVEQSSASLIGATVGSTITVQTGDAEPVSFTVSGVVRDVGIPPGWMDHAVSLYAARGALRRLGKSGRLDELRMTLRSLPGERTAVRTIGGRIAKSLERDGRRILAVAVPEPMRHPHAAQMDSLLVTQGLFGVLALALSAFLIVNLMGATIARQLREIGVMKAVGGRTSQIVILYLALAALIGGTAGLAVLPIALWLGRLYGAYVAQLLNFDLSQTLIPWWVVAIQASAGALLATGAALVPALRGCRMPVVAALRGSAIDAGGRAISLPRIFRRLAVPRSLSLGFGNLARHPGRASMTVVSLALGGAVFLGARTLRRGVIASVDQLFAANAFDASLRFATDHAADSLERAVRAVAGVRDTEAWLRASATLVAADGLIERDVGMTGVPAGTRMLRPTLVAGRWLDDGGARQLVIARRLVADQPELVLGASVHLIVAGRSQPWQIVGIIDAGLEEGAYASRAALAGALQSEMSHVVTLTTADRTDAGRLSTIRQARDQLRLAGLDVRSAQLPDAGRDAIEDHLVLIVTFLGAMAEVMVVVGGLGLASTMSISVIERTREIGVLRAIGATPRAVQGLVHTEGLCIAALSLLTAIALSIPIARGLGAMFGRIMFPVPVPAWPDAASLGEWGLLLAIVSMLASLLPARRASAIAVREALAYE